MLTRQEMIERMKKAKEEKIYFTGITDYESLTDEEIIDQYANMQNYLSDIRTHTNY